jgi:hypothetical protein
MPHKFIADECLKAVEELDSAISDNVPDTIYHYTKAESFRGIIESREIWMTNAFFVNDKMELRHFSDCNDLFEDTEFKNPELFDEFKNEPQQFEPKDVEDYYLASFSKNGESLSQFCAYGNYCIGFESQKLKKNNWKGYNNFNLFKCVYNQEDIKKWIIEKDKLEEWQNECFHSDRDGGYKRFAFYGVKYAARAKLKNKHYESEKEIRLLAYSDSSLNWEQYKGSPAMLCQPAIYSKDNSTLNVPVPYIKFFIPKRSMADELCEERVRQSKSTMEVKQVIRDIENKQGREILPIKEVIIGPMQNQEEAVAATKLLLCENGYENVKVKKCNILLEGIIGE